MRTDRSSSRRRLGEGAAAARRVPVVTPSRPLSRIGDQVREHVARDVHEHQIEPHDLAGLLIAVDTVAAVLVRHARTWGRIVVGTHADDQDLYLRLTVPVRTPDQAVSVEQRERVLLRALVGSVELTSACGHVIAVIQQPHSETVRV